MNKNMISRSLLSAALIGTALSFAPPVFSQEAQKAEKPAKRQSYRGVTAATAPVADAYVAAYTGRDWDVLEPLLAEGASFEDPTATHIFGKVLSEGRTAMMERFRVGYVGLTHMEFTTNRRLISAETAIYEGVLHWGMKITGNKTVDSVTPMVIVLTVENGKVTRHQDLVDYAPFIAAMKKARTPEWPSAPEKK